MLRDIATLYSVTYPLDGSTTRYGDPVRVEAGGITVACSVFRQGRGMAKEDQVAEDRRTVFFRVIVGSDVTVDGLSRMVWRGHSYEVVGEVEPIMYRNGLHHYEFTIRGVEGG